MTDYLPLLLIGAAIAWKFWPQLLALAKAGGEVAGDAVEAVTDTVTDTKAEESDTLVSAGLEAFSVTKRDRVGFLMSLKAEYNSGQANGTAVKYLNYLIRCETGANDIDLEWEAEEDEDYEE